MKLKGSYTIEMALLMPAVLAIVFGILLFAFFLYDRAVLYSMAFDILITGDRDQEERARILLHDVEKRVETSKNSVYVSYQARIQFPVLSYINRKLGQREFQVEVTMKGTRADPVSTIRNCRKLQKGLEMTTDGV